MNETNPRLGHKIRQLERSGIIAQEEWIVKDKRYFSSMSDSEERWQNGGVCVESVGVDRHLHSCEDLSDQSFVGDYKGVTNKCGYTLILGTKSGRDYSWVYARRNFNIAVVNLQ